MSSSSELDSGSGMESVGMIFTWGLPCSLWRKVSLYCMGKWDQSCLSLAVEMVNWLPVLSVVLAVSDSESGSEELKLWEEDVIVGDEGSKGAMSTCSVVVCRLPFKETSYVSKMFKHISAFGGGPELGLDWGLDGFVWEVLV